MKITIIHDIFFNELSDEWLTLLQETAPEATFFAVRDSDVEVADLIDSEIVFGRIPPHMLKELPNLKWLHLGSAGADGMTDISLYANKSTLLTKSSGTFGISISEHVIGMMITLSRNFGYYFMKQGSNEWCSKMPVFNNIADSTVLIIGLGDIGTEVCRHLSGYRCKFIGFRRDASKPHKLINDVRPISQLHKSLPEADYIIICTPGTNETEKLIGHAEFEQMKSSAIIINVGRGKTIDNDALVEALNKHKIGGAGLDVTDPEPLPAEHPLWSARNVFITPHVSGITQVSSERRVMIFIDLLKRYRADQELYNLVDFSVGY